MNKNNSRTIEYTDEPIQLGKRVDDFLPPPDALADAEEIIHVTIPLRRDSIEFLHTQALAQNTPYEVLIQRLLDQYANGTLVTLPTT